MAFKCKNCGRCCEDQLIPINLTLGDVYRFSQLLNQPINQLFQDFIAVLPFKDQENTYTIELGINKPCTQRKNQQCTIYPARPLNCRIFPYWLLGIKEAWPDTVCMENLNLTAADLKKYKEYKDTLGKIIIEESKITDSFTQSFFQEIKIDSTDDYQKDFALAKSLIKFDQELFLLKLSEEINRHKIFWELNFEVMKKIEEFLFDLHARP